MSRARAMVVVAWAATCVACAAPRAHPPPRSASVAPVATHVPPAPRLHCAGTDERLTLRCSSVDLREVVAELMRVTGRCVYVPAIGARPIDVDVDAAPWREVMQRVAAAADLELICARRYTALATNCADVHGHLAGWDADLITLRLDDGRNLDLWLPSVTGRRIHQRARLVAELALAREGDRVCVRHAPRADGAREALELVAGR